MRLVAQKQGPAVGLGRQAVETFGEATVEVLGEDGFEISSGPAGIEALIEASGEETSLKGGGTKKCLLGQSDVFDGEELLRIDGPVEGDEVGLEVGYREKVFGADDGEVGCSETVLAGVMGGASLALGRARAGGTGGVRAIGSETPGGAESLGMRQEGILPLSAIAWGGAGVLNSAGRGIGRKGVIGQNRCDRDRRMGSINEWDNKMERQKPCLAG
jgi:hypothetical protein